MKCLQRKWSDFNVNALVNDFKFLVIILQTHFSQHLFHNDKFSTENSPGGPSAPGFLPGILSLLVYLRTADLIVRPELRVFNHVTDLCLTVEGA